MTRACLDCGAVLTSKSPRCPEHRAARDWALKKAANRRAYVRWYAQPEHRKLHEERERVRRRRAQIARLHALAEQLGYILVPL